MLEHERNKSFVGLSVLFIVPHSATKRLGELRSMIQLQIAENERRVADALAEGYSFQPELETDQLNRVFGTYGEIFDIFYDGQGIIIEPPKRVAVPVSEPVFVITRTQTPEPGDEPESKWPIRMGFAHVLNFIGYLVPDEHSTNQAYSQQQAIFATLAKSRRVCLKPLTVNLPSPAGIPTG